MLLERVAAGNGVEQQRTGTVGDGGKHILETHSAGYCSRRPGRQLWLPAR